MDIAPEPCTLDPAADAECNGATRQGGACTTQAKKDGTACTGNTDQCKVGSCQSGVCDDGTDEPDGTACDSNPTQDLAGECWPEFALMCRSPVCSQQHATLESRGAAKAPSARAVSASSALEESDAMSVQQILLPANAF
jgi:hypothetical protein